jgi:hypothetical protein
VDPVSPSDGFTVTGSPSPEYISSFLPTTIIIYRTQICAKKLGFDAINAR